MMHILLTHHFPLATTAGGRHCRLLAAGLASLGHQVRVLLAADAPQPEESFGQRVVLCRPGDPDADLPFPLPGFTAQSPAGLAFADLTAAQLAEFREQLRHHLDIEVAEFDPHIIHAQHLWLEGQLALETGVPYVVTAGAAALDTYAADPRYHSLVDQAAENAGRIVVADQAIGRRVAAMFEGAQERILVLPPLTHPASAHDVEPWLAAYRDVYRQRFGREP